VILRRTKKQLNTEENWQLLKLESNVKGGIRSLHKSMASHLQSIQMRILQVIFVGTQLTKVFCGATQLIQVHDGTNVPAKFEYLNCRSSSLTAELARIYLDEDLNTKDKTPGNLKSNVKPQIRNILVISFYLSTITLICE